MRIRSSRSRVVFVACLVLLGALSSRESEGEMPDISRRINAFTVDLLKCHAGTTQAPANTILSAQSIFHGLAMSYIAGGGQTREELRQTVHFPEDDERLLSELSLLRRQLEVSAKDLRIECNLANSAWLDTTYAEFQPAYVSQVKDTFG